MADNEAEQARPATQERVPWFPRLKNTLKEFSNKHFGTNLHYTVPRGQSVTILPTWDRLQEEIVFDDIAKLNRELIIAERKWDGGTPETTPTAVGTLRKNARELYLELGPFYDLDTLSREMTELVYNGTGETTETVTINIPGLGARPLSFPVPTEQTVTFSHGLSYNIGFVGTQNNTYFPRLGTAINNFLESIQNELLLTSTDDRIQQNIKDNIIKLGTGMRFANRYLGTYLQEFETAHRSFLSGLDERGQAKGPLQELVLKGRVEMQHIVYWHTYLLTKPYYLKEIRDEVIKEIKDDGEIVTEPTTRRMPVYFNPDTNPYRDELEDVNRQIQNLGGETKRDEYKRQLTQINDELNRRNDEIKKLMSDVIEKVFGRNLLKDIYKELDAIYTKKEELVSDFLKEIRKKIIELLTLLKRPQLRYFPGLRYAELREGQYFNLHTGQILRDLNDLLTALTIVDDETLRYHTVEHGNDFGNWVEGVFGDRVLAREIFNAGANRDVIIAAVRARLSAISKEQYTEKLNELFTFIDNKLNELNINIDRGMRDYLDRLKRALLRLPSIIDDRTINEKRTLLMELYNWLYNPKPRTRSILNDYINTFRNRMSDFLKVVLQKIKELAESPEQELEIKKEELFNLVIDKILQESGLTQEEIKSKKEQLKLEENQMTDEAIKKLKRITYTNFNFAINNKGIITAKRLRAQILLRNDETLRNLKNLSQLLFRRDRLNYYIRELRPNLGNFTPQGNEVDWGVDENGWPLEVAEAGYKFKAPQPDGTYREEDIDPGTVLLDVFYRRRPYRRVPMEFTEYADLLDMSAWVYVNYDAYRDDLRDGRYHTQSLSVMEYILKMREIETPYLDFEHADLNQSLMKRNPTTGQMEIRTEHTHSTMKLNNPPNRPAEVMVELKPSHLNPAFDIRRGPVESSKKDIHLGRKLYYDLQENTENSNNPTMSTRGAALWILARVIEDTKYFENDTIQLLDAIGTKTLGFDIGPNLQGYVEGGEIKLKRWGTTLTKNPFRPIAGVGWTDIT